MFDNGLLLLTSTALRLAAVPKLLRKCSEMVRKSLLVYLINSQECVRSNSHATAVPYSSHVLSVINEFYHQSVDECRFKDLTFVVHNVTNDRRDLPRYSLSKKYDVVLTDVQEEFHEALKKYLKMNFSNHSVDAMNFPLVFINTSGESDVKLTSDVDDVFLPQYDTVCLGGTFDYLHVGHKILLTQGVLMAREKLIVGTTHGEMNKKKVLYELMEPTSLRMDKVKLFLKDIKQNLDYQILPIEDPFGPSIEDSSIQAIAVSEETRKGANLINEKRKEIGFNELQVEVVKMVYGDDDNSHCEDKISSTGIRKQLLGTLLRKPEPKSLSRRPYLIGLTGSIASGKTSIGKRLEKLGAGIVNCDMLGHRAYEPGTETFQKVVMAFGNQIVDESGNIDRKSLGKIVFSDKAKMSLLNSIVWPQIIELAQKEVNQFRERGVDVVVLDAAVLLEAKWDESVHEVWTAIIPTTEAEARIMERNKLSREEAKLRINSQMRNEDRIKRSHVVLCTLWEYEVTQKQVEKAWALLQERMAHV